MRSIVEPAINLGDASLASLTSGPIDASLLAMASAHVVATGSPVGTVKFQGSNELGGVSGPTTWTDINQSVNVPSSGSFYISKFDSCYQWLRLVYTKTSGTGAITVNFKGIGF